MTNIRLDISQYADVEILNLYKARRAAGYSHESIMESIYARGRDNARTPMQWEDRPNAGFTTGTPWLSVNGNYPRINAAKQENDPHSVLTYYRQLIAFRNGSETLQAGDFTELYRRDGVYAYRRNRKDESLTVVISLSAEERPNPASGAIVLSNYDRQENPPRLSPYAALILREV